MRLKVTSKIAVDRIDEVIKIGSDSLADLIDVIHQSNSDLEDNDKITKEDCEKILREYVNFRALVSCTFDDIFQHEAPLFELELLGYAKNREEIDSLYCDYNPQKLAQKNQLELEKYYETVLIYYESTLKVALSYYKEVSKIVKSPMFYLEKQCQICFYDLVCQLKPSTNESELCKKLFEYSFGEKIDDADVYEYITGEDTEGLMDMESRKKIKNAVDGVNRKTKKYLGFSIIEHKKNTLNLFLPARVLDNF